MNRLVIPFPKVQSNTTFQQHGGKESSMQYYEALGNIRDTLKDLAKEHDLSLKEVMIDLTYFAVGDEIVNKLIEGEDVPNT